MKPRPTSPNWIRAIAEGRALYIPRDGDGSYYRECVSAEDAQAQIQKSRNGCFDVDRYAARLVLP